MMIIMMLCALLIASPVRADMAINRQTYTYKTAGNCEIQADVYRLSGDAMQPVILWFHGGALIMGKRGDISPEQLDMYLNAGYTVITIDYRLAPETKIEGIIQDVQDACKWVREKGPELLNIDPDRMAVIGHSAGGYLTLMAGFCVEPRPKALVSFYGYGDIVGDWYTTPSPFYCNNYPATSEQAAYKVVGEEAISNDIGQGNRALFYLYCRQQGLWPREVTGHDPDAEPAFFDPFCPIRNVTAEYPPTLLLHGDADTDVPYEQSVMMANELKQIGVEHEFITIPNGGHLFDQAGIGNTTVANAFEKVLLFLKQHVQQWQPTPVSQQDMLPTKWAEKKRGWLW
jgi:acetyl esterase/lipase